MEFESESETGTGKMTDHEIICVSSIDGLKTYHMTDIAVAAGIFDGVHSGHVKLLTTLKTLAAELHAVPVAMTFYPHPRELLDPENAPPMLVSFERKAELLRLYGMKALIRIPFTREFAALKPEEFLRTSFFSSESVRLRGLCVGSAWRFGAGGSGDTRFLSRVAAEHHFEFLAVEEQTDHGEVVSSTLIRRAIAEGDIPKANRLLGRRYQLIGEVRHGMGVAGSRLGHPTANLDVSSGLTPKHGVYAGIACFDGERHPAVANIGFAPTFPGYGLKEARVEIHLLDGERSLYGKKLSFELLAFLREEKRFENPEALAGQIRMDADRASRLLETLF